jgi:hypothetical protein
MSGTDSGADASGAGLTLTCQPGRDGDGFAFPYTVNNGGRASVYVMDALPRFDPEAKAVIAERDFALVIAGPGEDVTVGRFIPPLPTDRRIAVPTLPLARLLPAGGALTGRFALAEPLAETTPYFTDLTLRHYKLSPIQAVVVRIGFWSADTPGFAAAPLASAPELFIVAMQNAAAAARFVSRRFPTKALQVFRRADAFPRFEE